MPGTGKLHVDVIKAATAVENYAGDDIRPGSASYTLAAKYSFGSGTNLNTTNYVDGLALVFDPGGITSLTNGTTITIADEGTYQCSFNCRLTGGVRTNAGFQWDINGSIQPFRYQSNYSRGTTAQQGGTHNFSSDTGTALFEVGSNSTLRLRGSQLGNTGTITAPSGVITIIKIASP